MAIVQFSDRDMLRGTVVTPAWYRVRIDSVGEGPAKDQSKGPSTNYPVEATILFEGDTGDTQFASVPVDWNFNSKAIGFAVGFLQAFGVKVEAGKRFDLKSAEGKEVDVFVENDTYQNRTVNRVNHKYREIRPEVTPVARS
ncbi:MAG TPA: hypothetical protein VE971_03825 [Candidatus Eisenbacteria bacterium]|nr:hypothetical protein [Candidatus Eisenbacteria bacterium]